MRNSIRAGLAIIGLVSLSCAAHARTLYWDALDVDARLERDGRLHVVERHAMVFDGDWNGGERRFRIESGQRLRLIALSEIDPVRFTKKAFGKGQLNKVGDYSLIDGTTLRWRSRLPTDPPFRHAKRVYEIEYELARVVRKTESGYRLSHDFAFPDRSGSIDHFNARLTLDPAWQVADGTNLTLERDDLRPGAGAVLKIAFNYIGAGAPRSIASPKINYTANQVLTSETHIFITNPEPWRFGALFAVIGFVCIAVLMWYRHDRRAGKFLMPTPPEQIDRAWLQQHLLRFPAEFVGAAWDLETSSNEVAAVLARMTQEGKLTSSVTTTDGWFSDEEVLHLTLQCDRESLSGYERKLIDALFLSGNTTNTDEVKKRYRYKGFDPAKLLKPALESRIKKLSLGGQSTPVPVLSKVFTAALLLLAGGFLAFGVTEIPDAALFSIFVILPLAALWLWGRFAAQRYRHAVDALFSLILKALQVIAIAMVVLVLGLFGNFFDEAILLPIGFALATAGIANSILNTMRYCDSLGALRFRKTLVAVRQHFARELAKTVPKLEDAWFPYVLAFGLGPNVDRWFKLLNRADATLADSNDHDSNSSSSGSIASTSWGTSSWTGGGGLFGGGGASGSWVAAVGGIAATFSASASNSGSSFSSSGGSSDSSSSSDSGSSSGGGGGGGW